MVTAHVGDRPYASSEIFFARIDANAAGTATGSKRRLFDPAHLLHWLRLVGVFDVGIAQDGRRLCPADYNFNLTPDL